MERVCEKLLAVRDGGGAVDDNAVSIAMMGATVWPRARPGWLHTRGVSYRKSVLHGAFVWACGALNRPKRRIWARADRVPQAEHGGGGGRVLPHLEPLLHDIPLALGFLDAWTQHVVLREFVTIPTQYEMRAFVYDCRLTALCQYCPGPARAFTHPSRFP